MKQNVLGLMSGTSLDGLDLALCQFEKNSSGWKYHLLQGVTYPLPDSFVQKVRAVDQLSGLELSFLDIEFANLSSEFVLNFQFKTKENIDLIASHGQTIFHQPSKGLTLQIGSGAIISSKTGIDTICDFRTTDVALGGQGAPLVPIGDQLLFSSYESCINIGGFANISRQQDGKRVAWDICPTNVVMNQLSSTLGAPYDKGGNIARSGKVNQALLNEFLGLSFFREKGPKSLGIEWANENIFPLLNQTPISVEDKLRTYVELIAILIERELSKNPGDQTIITGGGAYNSFLIKRIVQLSNCQIIVPEKEIIEYKEAIIFAFMGYLRYHNKINVLASVTGAQKDHSAGCIYLG